MAKSSPTPWRVEIVNRTCHVVAADGGFVALFVSEADAAFIVEAVNGVEATRELQRKLLGWSMERDRLRDLVRRMIQGVEEDLAIAKAAGESFKGLCALRGVDSSEVDEVIEQWSSLLREAREAIGEAQG